MAMTEAEKMATALREVLKNIQMDIPDEANDNLRDFLFGEGAWQEPCPFCTKTYPEIIRRLKQKIDTETIEGFLKGDITDEDGITTVALKTTGLPTFGGFDDMPHENLAVRLITPANTAPPAYPAWPVTISGAVNLEVAEFVANHLEYSINWTIGPNGKTSTIYPRVRSFSLSDMPTLQTLKLAIPEVYLDGKIGTAVTSVTNCEALQSCEITALGEHGNIPSFSNVKRGFELDLRPIGVTKDEFNNPDRRPWERFGPGWWNGFGLSDVMGVVLCTDGEAEY